MSAIDDLNDALNKLNVDVTEDASPPPEAEDSIPFCFSNGISYPISKKIVDQIPYLSALIRNPTLAKQINNEFVLPEEATPSFMKPLVAYLSTAYVGYLLKKLGKKEDIFEFVTFLDFMGVQIPQGKEDFDTVCKGLRNSTSSYIEQHKSWQASVGSVRALGRSYGVKFLVGIVRGVYDADSTKAKLKLFNGYTYIFSHPGTFGARIRCHALTVYNAKIKSTLSLKQEKIIQKWISDFDPFHEVGYGGSGDGESTCSDRTTSEEEYDGYSDY